MSSSGSSAGVDEVTELIQSLSGASHALSRGEQRDMFQLSTAGQHTLAARVTGLIERAAGSPMLTSKSADGTPITVVHRTRHHLPSGAVVVRSGRTCEEFLLKNQFVRARLPGSGVETMVLLQEPVLLAHGKTAERIWQACVRDWNSLRDWGHQGCSVEHYSFDRCSYSAYER